ncbi:MAG: 3,4-dihydroxy-2-butanone-4-phosphate synthase [Verrucomicrobiae bacterium]|nr:3,4-dihydroxy-2-butanone-4-phosphate synthase [Verrucomicrobiae bacterium]
MKTAIRVYQSGRPIIVYDADGREEECDLLLPAEYCTPAFVRQFRQDAGGLIFLAVPAGLWKKLGLRFMADLLTEHASQIPFIGEMTRHRLPYDATSSFSVSLNHVETFTGITDNDRSLTARSFGELALATRAHPPRQTVECFGKAFRSPGHIPLCLASEDLLTTRKGHTELACAMSFMAGTSGVSLGCEMMGDDGAAMTKDEVIRYARKQNIPFLEGAQIIEYWNRLKATSAQPFSHA